MPLELSKSIRVLSVALVALYCTAYSATEPEEIQSKEFIVEKAHLIVPVKYGVAWGYAKRNPQATLWITIDNLEYGPFHFVAPESAEDIDFYGHFPLEQFRGKQVKVRLERATEKTMALIIQSDTIPGEKNSYKEAYRPQFHFTARTGWLNDPNGLIYHNGEYHMYYQYYPFSVFSGNKFWGHAVSRDLIHWEEQPAVLFPNEQGACFSGATFIDRRNQLGLQESDEDVMVAFYLRTETGLSYAYSNDGGYTFNEYEGNPVLSHEGDRIDTPRPFWFEPTKRWIAPTYDFYNNEQGEKWRCVGIYSSDNLKDWKLESRVSQGSWGTELCGCVDFFQLPVDGDPNNKKWVMVFIDGSYIVGTFDGHTFFNKDREPAATKDRIQSLVVDHNYYATMTWHNMPNDRRVQITWMRALETNKKKRKQGKGTQHFTGASYGQQMTLPSELTLYSTDEGLRLRMNPIREFESLRTKTHEFQDVMLKAGENPLYEIEGDLFDLEVEFEPASGSETIFDMRGIPVMYNADRNELSCGSAKTNLVPIEGKIRLRIIQDRTSIEVYGNDGRIYIPLIQAPEKDNATARAYCSMGIVKFDHLSIHKLKSICCTEGRHSQQ